MFRIKKIQVSKIEELGLKEPEITDQLKLF